MNKRGDFSVLVYFMIGVVFFIVGAALSPALNRTSSEAMNNPQLNCSSSTITNQDRANCASIDLQTFIFTGAIFGLGGLLISRVVLG